MTQLSYQGENTRIKTYRQAYFHDKEQWILNVPVKTWVTLPNGHEVLTSETRYNAKVLPEIQLSFGRKISTNTYNSDGTLKRKTFEVTMNNGQKRFIDYGAEYYRGQPKVITVPQANNGAKTKTISLTTNSDGRLTSTKDFLGNVVDYKYNDNGRLTLVNYASALLEDSVISYEILESNDGVAGVSAGMLKQQISRGNYQKDLYLDGLYRPLVQVEQDVTDATSIRYTYHEFNSYNKQTFTSYPDNQVNMDFGISTVYDGMQRQIKSTSSSEIGDIITTTAYQPNNTVEVNDAKGNKTQTVYEAYSSPSYQMPIKILSKMAQVPDITTVINYNIFGNVTTIIQGGVTQKNIYNEQQRLCLTTRPDTGSNSYDYSEFGELIWSGASTHIVNASMCLGSEPSSSRTKFSYDNLGQLQTKTNYNKSNNQESSTSYEYDLNGNMEKATQSNGIINGYDYNSVGQLVAEKLTSIHGLLNIGYSYDKLGNIDATTYPSGLIVHHKINALGQSLKVASSKNVFASNAKYHAGGQLKSFNFGNGHQFNQTLNERQLPESISTKLGNKTALDFSYSYDQKANITNISDHVDTNYHLTMDYDSLDRLITADGKWGAGNLTYDALGNIKSYSLGSNILNYTYQNNRLKSVEDSKNIDFSYDERGNITRRNLAGKITKFGFDVGNQMLSANGIEYAYDAQGRRISITQGSALPKLSMYNLAGQLMHQLDKNTGKTTEQIYLGGKLVAQITNLPDRTAAINTPSNSINGEILVTWDTVNEATSYILERSTNGVDWHKSYEGVNTSFNATSLNNGNYYFRIKACNQKGCGSYRTSTVVKVLLPPIVPSSINVPTATVNNGIFSISWGASSTATKYILRQSVNGGGWTTVANPTSTSQRFSGKDTASYRYGVRACNASGCSGYKDSVVFSVLLPPPVPSRISAPTATIKNGAFTISWGASSTATKYTLRESVNGGGWATVANPTSTSQRFSGKGNATYRYIINACNASGCSGYRYSNTFSVLLAPLVPSSASVPTYDHNGVYNVTWNASATATHYMIRESVNGGSWTIIHGNVKSTSYQKTGAKNKTYRYGVMACNSSGCSGFRYTGNIVNTLSPSYISVPSIQHGHSVTISWGSVATKTRYILQEKVGSGSWGTLVSSTSATSFIRKILDNNTYQFRISACNNTGCSGYRTSQVVRVVQTPSRITYALKDADGNFGVSWERVTTATSYQVQQHSSGRWATVYNGSSTSVNMSGKANGGYIYRVRACHSNSCSEYEQGGTLQVSKPNLSLSLSKNYLNGAQYIDIKWTSKGADSCSVLGRNKPNYGIMRYYANCSKTISVSCKFGGQTVTKKQSVVVKYSRCGGGEDEF
ncbi:MAG: hypothetical protein HRU25_07045 [Psychrobium sp.]|nr:hypothetical protein [Psychrobium sp.]